MDDKYNFTVKEKKRVIIFFLCFIVFVAVIMRRDKLLDQKYLREGETKITKGVVSRVSPRHDKCFYKFKYKDKWHKGVEVDHNLEKGDSILIRFSIINQEYNEIFYEED